jgi:histidinol-phosphate aminotransferase
MAIRINKAVERLAPYVTTAQDPWRSPHRHEICKLDWNEGKGVPESLHRMAGQLMKEDVTYNWYPDCEAIDLTRAIARHAGVPDASVLTFPGSDVGLETVCRTILSEGDRLLMPVPTYDNFRVYAESVGCAVIPWPVDPPFRFNAPQFRGELKKQGATAVYIANPNNPCGYPIPRAEIRALCSEFPDAAIIVDEAYIDFCLEYSCAADVTEYENLIVSRTFSKAFGLAGLRLGFLMSALPNIRNLQKLRNGKNISRLAQELGKLLIANYDHVRHSVAKVVSTREYLAAEFARRGATVFPSAANFLLIELKRSKEVAAGLKRYGIYVRDRSGMIPDCIRISITDMGDARRLIRALDSYLREI